MSNKARVRQIEPQRIEKQREVSGHEADEILKKYGYEETQSSINHTQQSKQKNVKNNLTFEEMIKKEEEKKKKEREKALQKNKSKPITFNGRDGYVSKEKWDTDQNLGFGYKIEVRSDMDI